MPNRNTILLVAIIGCLAFGIAFCGAFAWHLSFHASPHQQLTPEQAAALQVIGEMAAKQADPRETAWQDFLVRQFNALHRLDADAQKSHRMDFWPALNKFSAAIEVKRLADQDEAIRWGDKILSAKTSEEFVRLMADSDL